MKKLMILMAILTMAVVAKAQHEEGDFMVQPKVGLNIATLSDADKSITDLHFGIEAEYMVADKFYTVDLDYVHVPILASYYVLPGLAVKAGVQPGFKMRAKAKFDDRTIDLDELYKLGSNMLGEDIKVSKFDLSIPVGISYEYKNIVLDARYNWGLIKVMNVGDAFYNRCFMLSLGYKLELGN